MRLRRVLTGEWCGAVTVGRCPDIARTTASLLDLTVVIKSLVLDCANLINQCCWPLHSFLLIEGAGVQKELLRFACGCGLPVDAAVTSSSGHYEQSVGFRSTNPSSYLTHFILKLLQMSCSQFLTRSKKSV